MPVWRHACSANILRAAEQPFDILEPEQRRERAKQTAAARSGCRAAFTDREQFQELFRDRGREHLLECLQDGVTDRLPEVGNAIDALREHGIYAFGEHVLDVRDKRLCDLLCLFRGGLFVGGQLLPGCRALRVQRVGKRRVDRNRFHQSRERVVRDADLRFRAARLFIDLCLQRCRLRALHFQQRRNLLAVRAELFRDVGQFDLVLSELHLLIHVERAAECGVCAHDVFRQRFRGSGHLLFGRVTRLVGLAVALLEQLREIAVLCCRLSAAKFDSRRCGLWSQRRNRVLE